ncbi:MAG: DUF2470 domain-containing protein [Gomphosphaeria aponina SAG 52.96 = DSM 107014]|uniref:DUF2470 domain-containing protein n=1 Tax=Gomphosphaeria aponina SAG 52.96 = DSM 107014 TaxID=1521640 RepID=A0A941GTA4_9CHRO|nr:DUF2470 domain-containing protein [Gomphosphaeria aponina SAG 52.96 = DSM 107014]
MSETITREISDRICQHMNEDHGEALRLYAQVFGKTNNPETAKMLSIDPQGMNLAVKIKENDVAIRIEFDHVLKDAADAHQTLIEMVKQARKMPKN